MSFATSKSRFLVGLIVLVLEVVNASEASGDEAMGW